MADEPINDTAVPSEEPAGELDDTHPTLQIVEPNESLLRTLWAVTGAAWGLCFLMALVQWSNVFFSVGPFGFSWGMLWLLPIPLHIFLSLKEIKPNEIGALYFFGSYVSKLAPGLKILPVGGFTNVKTERKDLETILEPGPRDKIFWGDEKDDLPKGMVRPVFMTTRAPKESEHLPLAAQLTVGLGYTVLWRKSDVATFYANVFNTKEVDEQLRSMSETALSEVIALYTADEAITQQAEVNSEFLVNLRKKTANWGIQIIKANLTIINLSHPLATAMRDRAKAEFESETRRIEAEGQAKAIELVGSAEGNAAHAKAFGEISGRAEGMAKTLKALEVSGSEVLAAETARATIPHANATILGEAGLLQAAAIGKVFGVGLNGTKPEEGK